MAQYLVSDTYLTNIANAIRGKLNVSTTYTPGEMSGAINSIQVATAPSLQNKTVTPQEYQQIIAADNTYDGLGSVTISAISSTYVGSGITRVNATTITPTNAEQTAIAANRYTNGIIKVSAVPTETKSITTNGTYTPSTGKWFSSVTVNVPTGSTISNQNKTVTPTESSQDITADSGYTGLGTVTVSAIPSNYVGSGITTQGAKTVTPTTSVQTAVASGVYTTGVISVAAIQTQTRDITANGTYTPSSGKYFSSVTVNVPTGSTISNQNKTVTPNETEQSVTADSGYTGLGTVTINAISPTYVGSEVTRKAAATIIPTTTNQSIAANTYLTGKQTISGDANLVAGNIKSGVSIFGVSGSYTGNGGGITPTGNLEITENGNNIDVTNYATVSVAVPSQGIVITDTTDANGGTIRTLTTTEFYGQAYTLDDFAMRNFSGSITLSTATKIGACTFAGSNITEIHAPNATQFYSNNNSSGVGVFQNCKSLTTIDLPNYTSPGSGGYQFAGDTALIHVFLPKGCTGQYMFSGCSNLQTAVLGGTGQMNANDYASCSKLEIVDTRNSRIHTSSFTGCSKLATLIVRRTSLCTLSNINAFTNTPFASGKAGGILYVPADLISEYEAATNWSTILGYTNNQIKSIESTHTDPNAFLDLTLYYGDGTPLGT